MIIIENRHIKKEYNIISKYTAGIVLKGWEVKAIKFKNIKIKNSYIVKIRNEIFLKDSYLWYDKVRDPEFIRDRKLLLNLKEIKIIFNNKKNGKILPLNFILKKNIIKLNIVIVFKKIKNVKKKFFNRKYVKLK